MFEPRVISHKKNYFRKNDKTKLDAKQYLFRSNINPYTNVSVWLLMWNRRSLTVAHWSEFGCSLDHHRTPKLLLYQKCFNLQNRRMISTKFEQISSVDNMTLLYQWKFSIGISANKTISGLIPGNFLKFSHFITQNFNFTRK